MRKKVVVQEGLHYIKNELSNLGYEVIDIKDVNDSQNIEAIVYMADGHDIEYHNILTNMNSGIDMANSAGTILVNAKGKTTEEIDNIIKKRVYSPLFD